MLSASRRISLALATVVSMRSCFTNCETIVLSMDMR
uniref:54S ribosomal protein L8-like n=1 Tax=Rhizophora mucronata TaxID=61149 RepID=A0A2P2K2E4_RHIMU